MCSAFGGEKRAADPQEQELQKGMLEMEPKISARAISPLNH